MVRNKLYICKEYHIQPSEIDRLVFFEYEYMLEDIKAEQKEAERRNAEEEKKYSSMNKVPNYNQMMSNVGRSMPSLSSFKMPKI